jgi:riboflavin biosynthesis pyrimidine reductase
VRLKIAASADGRTALPNGVSQWITSPEARSDGHRWRARACAVLTGAGTVLADDPRLDARGVDAPRQPHAVVLDSQLRTPPTARLFEVAHKVWIFTTRADSARREALEARGAEVIRGAATPDGRVALDAVMAELARRDMAMRSDHLKSLRDALISRLPQKVEHVYLTGHPTERLPWNASFVVEFIEGEGMLLFLDQQGVAVSSGSACTSRALKGSHVLTAMGIPPERAQGSILFSLGPQNSMEDIDYVLEVFPPIVERLRSMSPLYAKYVKERG